MSDPRQLSSQIKIAVVIATKNRSSELANRALRSVVEQTRRPDYVVVVDDSDRRYRTSNRRIVATVDIPGAHVTYRENDRTAGASGAWNVALDVLHRNVQRPTEVFVAVLDDDDRWAPAYLDDCVHLACSRGLDMVAADILRFEQLGGAPRLNPAPDSLCATDFLVGNPGIQGSNLFVRLSVLLASGLFDEGLRSTTDRDLCIRIADLGGVQFGRLAVPLVEHYADEGRERLTVRGSEPKLQGLTAFWGKYSCRMAAAQQEVSRERALKLFDWREAPVLPNSGTCNDTSPAQAVSFGPSVALVVGIIADIERPGDLMDLVGDLLRLLDDPRLAGLDVVILENGQHPDGARFLDETSRVLRDAGAGGYVVPLERQAVDARSGVFGEAFERQPGLATIAMARTMLQTYTYVVAKPRTGTVVWILDGDCRLDNLVWDGTQVVHSPTDILDTVMRLRSASVAVAIGTVTDAPPVPFASCIRTQLVDLYHNLESMAAQSPDAPLPDRQEANMEMRARCEDYYYDLSRRDTDHLEMPFWYVTSTPGRTVREAFREMVSRLPRILAGEQVFRPLILDGRRDPLSLMQPSIHRGGNTFVFDAEALRDFPNAAPHVDGTETRRSDMVWSLLNRYVAHRTVVKLPLAVRQDRRNQPVAQLDLEKLARDIQGYAVYSALEDMLLELHEGARWDAAQALPGLDGVDPAHLEKRVQKYLRERLAAFSLSFHRAAGLSHLLGRYVGEPTSRAPWWLSAPTCAEAVADLQRFVHRLRTEYDLTRLPEFERRVSAVGPVVVRRFLDQLRADLAARRQADDALREVERWVQHERVANAEHRVKKEYGVERLRLLGCGSEAVVLTDERTVYKNLDYWKTRMPQRQFDFLHDQVGRWSGVPGLYALNDVRSTGSSAMVTYDYESSTPYVGGHGESLIRLLQGCRQVGIVCNNIHPDNLVVSPDGVKLIDYGADVRPFSVEGFEHMARRAFLSCRHPRRTDLKEIMRAALDRSDLPELEGFQRFREALEPVSKEQLLDLPLTAELGGGEGRALLDYGCGKGKLAEMLADAGWSVTAYDPDPALTEKWRNLDGGVEFGGHPLLARLRSGCATFDAVVCSLVLCLLDDHDLHEVLLDLGRFTVQGGLLVVAICNPRFVGGTTQLQRRLAPDGVDENDVFRLEKLVFSTNVRIVDVHRPMQQYLDRFEQHGFAVEHIAETPGVDLETFERNSDFVIFRLRRVNENEGVCHGRI
jgi:SAM-dependent methyltransferase